MISGDQVQRLKQNQPQQLGEEQAEVRRGWWKRRWHGGWHVVHVCGGSVVVGGRVSSQSRRRAIGERAPPVLQVLVADGGRSEEADQETTHGNAGALGDAVGARVPGQHAHRLVQL